VWYTHGHAEQLDKRVRELYDIMCRLEEEKYDWEIKLFRQNAEVTLLGLYNTLQQLTVH